MMERVIIVSMLILLNGSSLVFCNQVPTHASETSLRTALRSGYDAEARPYSPTYVQIDYFLRSVQELNIATQSLQHTAFVNLIWHDPRLVWNASDYSNITSIDVKWVWRPIFMITNGLDDLSVYGGDDNEMRMILYNNGSVFWQQGIRPTTVCDVDVVHFPYDDQSCQIQLSFLGYSNDKDISLNFTSIILLVYLENEEWVLKDSSMELWVVPVCCPITDIGTALVTLHFKRLHAFYLNTFLIPTYLLSVCLIWPFYLPTESGERLGFSLTILLSYTVVLTLTADFLPTSSREVPIIAGYLLGVLVLCSLAVCNITINVKIYYLESDPPKLLKKIYRKLNPIVFMQISCKRKNSITKVKALREGDKEKPPIDIEDPEIEEAREEVTWAKISILLDRICFLLYSFAVFCLNISLVVTLV